MAEGMRLFGEQGYAGTSVAQIEEAAGLSAGSGALYKHFRSKKEILATGMRQRIQAVDELAELLGSGAALTGADSSGRELAAGVADRGDARELFREIARSGLERLEHERDVNRILIRDLAAFPDLLAEFRSAEIAGHHAALTAVLTTHAADHPAVYPVATGVDWAAVAAILQDALSHYWLMTDIYGGRHPTGTTEDSYLDTLAELAVALLPPTTKDVS